MSSISRKHRKHDLLEICEEEMGRNITVLYLGQNKEKALSGVSYSFKGWSIRCDRKRRQKRVSGRQSAFPSRVLETGCFPCRATWGSPGMVRSQRTGLRGSFRLRPLLGFPRERPGGTGWTLSRALGYGGVSSRLAPGLWTMKVEEYCLPGCQGRWRRPGTGLLFTSKTYSRLGPLLSRRIG